MQIRTLAGISSFGLQIAAGAATVMWPDKVFAEVIFWAASAGVVGCVLWWLFANYRLRWPMARRVSVSTLNDQFSQLGPTAPLDIVANRTYIKENVKLDGRHFINCHFTDTLIQWDGGLFKMSDCHLNQPMHFMTHHNGIQTVISLLREIGLVNDGKFKRLIGENAKTNVSR